MTDKTPSSQEPLVISAGYDKDGNAEIRVSRPEKEKPHDLEETPTVKGPDKPRPIVGPEPVRKDGEPKCTCSGPQFLPEEPNAHYPGCPLHSRDAKKCTCKWDNSGDQRDYQTEPVIIAPDVNCPKHGHGDGAKKEQTCICENPNTYSGRNMNCPIHPFKRDAAPRDSLDEIKKCLGEYAEKYYLAAEENDPSPDLDYYVTKVQDWHITQVREFAEEIREILDEKYDPSMGTKSSFRALQLQRIHELVCRALERLEDRRSYECVCGNPGGPHNLQCIDQNSIPIEEAR